MSIKNIMLLLSTIVLAVLVAGSAFALSSSDITIVSVEANDVGLSLSSPKTVEKADELEVLVVFDSNVNSSNFQVEAVLRGADLKNPVEDISEVFDVKSGNRYDKKLILALPLKMEQGRYDLKIRFDDRTGNSIEKTYPLDIGTDRHSIEIRDVVTDPEGEINSGRTLAVSVRLKNRGKTNEEDLKIKVSIPELGVSASDFIDVLDKEDGDDDSATSEFLYLRIPESAKTGDYTVKTVVEYDDGDRSISKSSEIRVIGKPAEDVADYDTTPKEQKPLVTVGPESQPVQKGASAFYTLSITNFGQEARSFTVDVDGATWAGFKVSPSSVVVVNNGETKSLSIEVTPKDSAPTGEQAFAVTIKSGETVQKQILLKANVLGGATGTDGSSLKRSLEIGLVVLIVLLVILALFIGFSKLRGDEEKPKEEGYY